MIVKTPACLTVSVILLSAGLALADGMFISPPGSFMYEPVQQAFLDWDDDTSTESLTILPAFQGDAASFAWIVPVPGLPELELADRQLFYDLDGITHPVYRYRDGEWDCFGSRSYDIYASGDNGVQIIESETIGFYQTMILSSDDAPALLDSLTTWGFLHSGNIEDATAAISDYVEMDWYFVTMQVDSTALEEYYYNDYYYYPYGGLDPITLTFPTETPVYPMKISAYSAADETRVHLYVKADHRMTFDGAETFYANRFSTQELSELPYYPSLREVFQPGDFLTKLNRGYTPAQMTQDIYLVRSDSDDEFRLINYSGWPVTTLVLLGSPVIWGMRRSFRSRKR